MIRLIGNSGANFLRAMTGAGEASIGKQIGAPATLTGSRGKAWLCDIACGRRERGFAEADNATLAHWLIEAPWAHPVWHSYSLVLIHLRPDGRETKFYLDGATHELILWAIDPDIDRTEIVKDGLLRGVMTPVNFGAQIIEIRDDLALERVEQAVRRVVEGKLSPDSDHIRAWARLFGDNMIKREYR